MLLKTKCRWQGSKTCSSCLPYEFCFEIVKKAQNLVFCELLSIKTHVHDTLFIGETFCLVIRFAYPEFKFVLFACENSCPTVEPRYFPVYSNEEESRQFSKFLDLRLRIAIHGNLSY